MLCELTQHPLTRANEDSGSLQTDPLEKETILGGAALISDTLHPAYGPLNCLSEVCHANAPGRLVPGNCRGSILESHIAASATHPGDGVRWTRLGSGVTGDGAGGGCQGA